MKTIQFILSILISICAALMLYGAISIYSPMRVFSIIVMSIIFAGCILLLKLTYKELK